MPESIPEGSDPPVVPPPPRRTFAVPAVAKRVAPKLVGPLAALAIVGLVVHLEPITGIAAGVMAVAVWCFSRGKLFD